jgi:hyperosmotically inducible periplasmic protein
MMNTKLLHCVLLVALGSPIAGLAADRQLSAESKQFSDTAVTARIKTVFAKNEELNGANIQIRSTKGVVRLAGFAQSQEDADRAVALAKGVKGVVRVRNDITVGTSSAAR